MKAVLLLSGGLDSATTGAIAKAEGYALHALSFDYGQRHKHELEAAKKVAAMLDVEQHKQITIDLRAFGGSALTDAIDVPKQRSHEEMGQGVPVTYVPARNTIFLSFALAYAESQGIYDIFLGVNALDYSGYPDCRPQFIRAFEAMANLGTAYAQEQGRTVKLHAPLIELTKAQIIEHGLKLGVDYALTTSCYDPDVNGNACGECDACQLRLKGFAEAGAIDPIQYQRFSVKTGSRPTPG